jgi:hypothetical protein
LKYKRIRAALIAAVKNPAIKRDGSAIKYPCRAHSTFVAKISRRE